MLLLFLAAGQVVERQHRGRRRAARQPRLRAHAPLRAGGGRGGGGGGGAWEGGLARMWRMLWFAVRAVLCCACALSPAGAAADAALGLCATAGLGCKASRVPGTGRRAPSQRCALTRREGMRGWQAGGVASGARGAERKEACEGSAVGGGRRRREQLVGKGGVQMQAGGNTGDACWVQAAPSVRGGGQSGGAENLGAGYAVRASV